MPRAVFRNAAKAHNNGCDINCISPSECRMAAEHLCVFRMEDALDHFWKLPAAPLQGLLRIGWKVDCVKYCGPYHKGYTLGANSSPVLMARISYALC